MSGESRSRWRVAKRLDAFLAKSRDAIANLEAETHSARSPSAVDACGDEELAEAGRAGDVNLAQPHSPTALDILAGSSEAAGATVAAEDADIAQPRSGQSPTNSVATEILNSEDDEEGGSTESVSGSESTEEEEQEVVGTPTAALCEQVVPLLRYLDRKVEKYADPRQPGSYVELVKRRTRTKVHTSKLLARVDQELKDLRERHDCLWGHLNLTKKMYKALDRTKDEKLEDFAKAKAKRYAAQLPGIAREFSGNQLLARFGWDIQDLRLKNEALRGHIALSRKLQKAVDQTRDEKFEETKKEFAKEKAKLADELDSEQT
ncbi:hypothetical protein AXG93_2190s1320 [Marchantia polymorpha subsp. ruderalis]|uniref:Uncharacterized protein n=1 Tax=Marchantia polymorpha subsp. ruderalis TaxID=1480154 RepID=A0A176WIZ4_MARPO|nr:hypothetical protein AXG93_2190s1320 [Marchantia polymorpha subsp. ruderalis]